MNALFAAIARHALPSPDAPALDPVVVPEVSRAQFVMMIDALAQGFQEANSNKRPVALQLDHGTQSVVLDLALAKAGLPMLSLPVFFTGEQRAHAISACGAQLADSFGEGDSSPPIPLPAGTARITFISGSTGAPKGICLSADHMITVAQAIVEAVGDHHAGRHLALLPPGILLETVAGLLTTMIAGGT